MNGSAGVSISFPCQSFNVSAAGLIPGLTLHIHSHSYDLNHHQHAMVHLAQLEALHEQLKVAHINSSPHPGPHPCVSSDS